MHPASTIFAIDIKLLRRSGTFKVFSSRISLIVSPSVVSILTVSFLFTSADAWLARFSLAFFVSESWIKRLSSLQRSDVQPLSKHYLAFLLLWQEMFTGCSARKNSSSAALAFSFLLGHSIALCPPVFMALVLECSIGRFGLCLVRLFLSCCLSFSVRIGRYRGRCSESSLSSLCPRLRSLF